MANERLIFIDCNIYSILAEYGLHSCTFRGGLWPMGLWFKVFTIYRHGGQMVIWPRPLEQTYVPPPQGGSIWNLAPIGPVVSEKKFENVDTHTYTQTYIRTTEAYLYYKLTIEPKGSGELIKPFGLYSVCEWFAGVSHAFYRCVNSGESLTNLT